MNFNSEHSYAWFDLGLTYEYLNKFKKAIECFEKAVECSPQWIKLREKLIEIKPESLALLKDPPDIGTLFDESLAWHHNKSDLILNDLNEIEAILKNQNLTIEEQNYYSNRKNVLTNQIEYNRGVRKKKLTQLKKMLSESSELMLTYFGFYKQGFNKERQEFLYQRLKIISKEIEGLRKDLYNTDKNFGAILKISPSDLSLKELRALWEVMKFSSDNTSEMQELKKQEIEFFQYLKKRQFLDELFTELFLPLKGEKIPENERNLLEIITLRVKGIEKLIMKDYEDVLELFKKAVRLSPVSLIDISKEDLELVKKIINEHDEKTVIDYLNEIREHTEYFRYEILNDDRAKTVIEKFSKKAKLDSQVSSINFPSISELREKILEKEYKPISKNKGKGLEKYEEMITFQLKQLEILIETTSDKLRKDILLERKQKLEYELKAAVIGSEVYKVLRKIVKNEEEYKELLEQKKRGEFVDDLIKQNRYLDEILRKQDKELCEKNKNEVEIEKKRTGEETPERPVMRAAFMSRPLNAGKIPSPYEKYFLSQPQLKKAQKLIEMVVKGFNLKKIPKFRIFGFNYTLRLNELEKKRDFYRARSLKEIDREIKYTKNNDDIILVIDFETQLKKLVFFHKFLRTTKFFANQLIWSGILNFPIPEAFLFGRVANRTQHGGGQYIFAPIKHEIIGLERITNRFGASIEQLIEQYYFIALLNKFCFSSQAIKSMKMGYHKYKSKTSSDLFFFNQLNNDSQLNKMLKKISHFGTLEHPGIIKYVSECDVSMFFCPYQDMTIFQVCDFKSQNKHTIPAINAIYNRLRDILG